MKTALAKSPTFWRARSRVGFDVSAAHRAPHQQRNVMALTSADSPPDLAAR